MQTSLEWTHVSLDLMHTYLPGRTPLWHGCTPLWGTHTSLAWTHASLTDTGLFDSFFPETCLICLDARLFGTDARPLLTHTSFVLDARLFC